MQVLVMFSGGKDSFLTACKVVEQGNRVSLLSFNSGCLMCEENMLVTAERLKNKYKHKVEVVGIRTCVSNNLRISRPWKELTSRELCKKYPDVTGVQAQCFFCQMSMWIEAVGYSVAHGIKRIACGYKHTDKFCTGSKLFLDFLASMCEKYGIEVSTVMWDFVEEIEGFELDQEFIRRRLLPRVFEPKCSLGLPAKERITDSEMTQLLYYFKNNIDYAKLIEKSSRILKVIPVTDKSME